MTVYPEWVRKFRVKGTAIKRVGNKYYLYKHTSKYVKGKKYPQCVDHYLGVITPDGVIYSSKKNVSLEKVRVYEYGFSKALIDLCPNEWKKSLGDGWHTVLLAIISKCSNESYLLRDVNIDVVTNRNINVHEEKLNKALPINELSELKTIYLISFDEREVISYVSDYQKEILDKYNIMLEGVSG